MNDNTAPPPSRLTVFVWLAFKPGARTLGELEDLVGTGVADGAVSSESIQITLVTSPREHGQAVQLPSIMWHAPLSNPLSTARAIYQCVPKALRPEIWHLRLTWGPDPVVGAVVGRLDFTPDLELRDDDA